jgi:hypothetical protein
MEPQGLRHIGRWQGDPSEWRQPSRRFHRHARCYWVPGEPVLIRRTWFEIDKNGLSKLLERRGKAFAILELIQTVGPARHWVDVGVPLDVWSRLQRDLTSRGAIGPRSKGNREPVRVGCVGLLQSTSAAEPSQPRGCSNNSTRPPPTFRFAPCQATDASGN